MQGAGRSRERRWRRRYCFGPSKPFGPASKELPPSPDAAVGSPCTDARKARARYSRCQLRREFALGECCRGSPPLRRVLSSAPSHSTRGAPVHPSDRPRWLWAWSIQQGSTDRLDVDECFGQATVLDNLATQLRAVVIPGCRVRIEDMEAGSTRRCAQQLAHQIIVLRQAVADGDHHTSARDSRARQLPRWLKYFRWSLTAHRRNEQRVAANGGPTVVIPDELSVADRPRNRTVELQKRDGPFSHDPFDVGIGRIAAAGQILRSEAIVEACRGTRGRGPVLRPRSASTS